MDEFVVVGVYQNVHQAYIFRDRLENEGIDAWITDENTVVNNPFFSEKLGGAKLNVKKEMADKALAILSSISTFS